MKTKGILSLLFFYFISDAAQAVIIDGKFSGRVQYQSDMSEWDTSYSAYWKENIAGEAISGSFWYDTDLAPFNSSIIPNQSVHESVGNATKDWLGLKIQIAGKLIDISNSVPSELDEIHREQVVVFEDYSKPVNWDNTDYFGIANVTSATNISGDYDYKWLTLRIEEPDLDFVSGTALNQEINWVNFGERDRVSLGLLNLKSSKNGEIFDASASLKLLSLSTSIRSSVSVSEPMSIMLCAFGFLVLGLRRLNRLHF